MGALSDRMRGLLKYGDLWLVGGLFGTILVLILPVVPFMLDLLLTISIAASLLVLLVILYLRKPADFTGFPTLLLFITLYRLALNVASTRLILLNGYAGHIIQAFGNFVVHGNYVVGMVVFLILVLINFIVITKGAGRIAEVAARFTLDALPGKQMAIDAELNAGLINETEARDRRHAIEEEADFYGAMDGASKFVRGDAIAAILITLINIVGGFAIGILQKGMTMTDALQTYTILTTDPNTLTAPIHSRMPVILRPEDYERWLAPADPSHLPVDLLKPYGAEEMITWKVSRAVGNVRNNDASLATPI